MLAFGTATAMSEGSFAADNGSLCSGAQYSSSALREKRDSLLVRGSCDRH